MSLHFSQDTLSKREKQEMFKKSLDDQRRLKQETSHQQDNNLPSNTGNHVPGLASSSVPPDDLSIPGLNQVVPGLNQRPGYAPRFEGSPSPQQDKQPYMSALSEMNGRPLHVRQQQFQKESQYRNMLKDQIEENKKRKEAEKAKLDEEKRLELEEVRRLQGMLGPRRQQHAQFQESPDHPLPSPGRLPPARPTHATVDRHQHQHRGGNVSDRAGAIAPVNGSAMYGGYASMNPHGINDRGYEGGGQRHPGAPAYRRDQVSLDYRRPYAHPQQTDTAVCAGDHDPGGRQDLASDVQARTQTSSRRFDEYRQGFGDAGRAQGQFDTTGQARGAESATGKLAFEEEGGSSAAQSCDSVPRADFDELSNLCRDLLLEQKELRRKLEDREERDRLAAERPREEMTRRPKKHQDREHQHQRGVARSGGAGRQPSGGTTSRRGDRIRRTQTLSGSGASRMQGGSNPSTLSRERKPVPKSGVAFGSTRSRMPSPTVEKPRVPPEPGAIATLELPRASRSQARLTSQTSDQPGMCFLPTMTLTAVAESCSLTASLQILGGLASPPRTPEIPAVSALQSQIAPHRAATGCPRKRAVGTPAERVRRRLEAVQVVPFMACSAVEKASVGKVLDVKRMSLRKDSAPTAGAALVVANWAGRARF
ncbi:unnamed protein product [Ectocarpus sp. CCAP 1310/34]|nr:unnamed protein product [Ectocarpus sp. CCAP 1310/34]